MIAAHIQPGIEYHFWTPDSEEIPPHTPFTDSEWDGIMDAMQEEYKQLKVQFIGRWKNVLKIYLKNTICPMIVPPNHKMRPQTPARFCVNFFMKVDMYRVGVLCYLQLVQGYLN